MTLEIYILLGVVSFLIAFGIQTFYPTVTNKFHLIKNFKKFKRNIIIEFIFYIVLTIGYFSITPFSYYDLIFYSLILFCSVILVLRNNFSEEKFIKYKFKGEKKINN